MRVKASESQHLAESLTERRSLAPEKVPAEGTDAHALRVRSEAAKEVRWSGLSLLCTGRLAVVIEAFQHSGIMLVQCFKSRRISTRTNLVVLCLEVDASIGTVCDEAAGPSSGSKSINEDIESLLLLCEASPPFS